MISHLLDTLAGKHPYSAKRSSRWYSVRRKHLLTQPKCALCSGTAKLNVHHIQPFHLHPELELEPSNLITLCESDKGGINCHLFFGHLGNFKMINPSVLEDVAAWSIKLKKL
jgi:5-methylcytosine-specific restriction protein A